MCGGLGWKEYDRQRGSISIVVLITSIEQLHVESQWTRPELPLQVDLRKEMFTAACARGLTGCDTEDREDGKEELLGEHGG